MNELDLIVIDKLAMSKAKQPKRDVEAQHPDEFIYNLFDLDSGAVASAVKRQRESLKNPPVSVDPTLEKQGLAQTVDELRYADLI